MLIHTTIHKGLTIGFYVDSIDDKETEIRIRVDVPGLQVNCDHTLCTLCPLNVMPNRPVASCWQRGIDYFQKVTKDQFPEWSI